MALESASFRLERGAIRVFNDIVGIHNKSSAAVEITFNNPRTADNLGISLKAFEKDAFPTSKVYVYCENHAATIIVLGEV